MLMVMTVEMMTRTVGTVTVMMITVTVMITATVYWLLTLPRHLARHL